MDKDVEYVTSRLSDRFWDTIALAKEDWPRFRSLVREMDPHALWQLYWTYRAAMGVLRHDEYQAQADSLLTEDSFDDLAGWIVAQGRDFYLDIVNNPELMLPDVSENPYPLGRPLQEISLTLPAAFDIPEDDSYFLQ